MSMNTRLLPEIDRVRLLLPSIDRMLPGFGQQTAGASPREIDLLLHTAGQPLPEAYLEFMRLAGKVWGGGANIIYGGSFSIDTMTEFWRDMQWPRHERFIPFAMAEDDPWLDLYLDLERLDGELPLICMHRPDDDDDDVVSGADMLDPSFTGAIFFRAWYDQYAPLWPCRALANCERRPGEMESASRVLAERGWAQHPLSSPWSQVFQRTDVEVSIYECRGLGSLTAEIIARKPAVLDEVAVEICRDLQLTLRRRSCSAG